MSKHIRFGNILDLSEGILIHGCNKYSIMGSGIALQIKDTYPGCFLSYTENLKQVKTAGNNPLGMVFPFIVSNNFHILNAITQENFGRDGKRYVDYSAIQKVFRFTADYAKAYKLPVHYPQVGAGLGGGDWPLISEIIDVELADVDRTLWIYES